MMMLAFGSLIMAVISLTQAISIRQENSLAGPFIAGGANLAFWDLTGSAQLEGGHIRLTPDEPEKQGAVWNSFPSISNNWEYQVTFRIHGKGVHLHGDGMAFWYVQESDMLHSGPVFGFKDYFCGLGVFVDTFENKDEPHKHPYPYISAMVNNGSLHYEHEEDGIMTHIGGCHAAVRNLEFPTKIAISYINNILALYVDDQGSGQWRVCFKSEGVHLPTGYHFGISASTHDSSDNHDVISVTSLNMDPDDKAWVDKADILPKVENVQIPLKYHKEFVEEELQRVEKREVGEEEEEEEEDEGEDEEEESEHEEAPKTKKVDSPQTSLFRKFIYITGSAVIIFIGISMYRKYSERRRERMQKRLF